MRKPLTPSKFPQEVFEVLAGARSLEDLRRIEAEAWEVYRRYLDELGVPTLGSWPSIVGSAG